MIESLILDSLLVLILALLIPIGAYRGGIREGFTAAGLLLGVAISAEWAVVWGDWVADNSRLAEGPARFLIASALLTVATIGVGYGSAAAFAYCPGPGGRLYGALLAATTGAVFLSYVLDYVITFLFNGDRPALIEDSYVAFAFSVGTGWILLACVGVVVLATAFGFIVRERADDETMGVDSPAAIGLRQTRNASRGEAGLGVPRVDKVEPTLPRSTDDASGTGSLVDETMPVHIREVRHWEREPTGPPAKGSPPGGWSHTWPASSTRNEVQPPWQRSERLADSAPRIPGQSRPRQGPGSSGSDVLQVWLRQDSGTNSANESSDYDRTQRPRTTGSERQE